jgi:7,8-dihydropterin-6-yl-methyl-4-(beta-D-ribofuranosyl)aminobenzene 5'-phosphate synthase
MKLTVLSDNLPGDPLLPVEHGFSAWIEDGSMKVLFDTGSSTLFADNARRLSVPWWEAQTVVLSHGHYDHTGGVVHAVGGNSRAKWYFHPDALLPRFRRRTHEGPKPIGMPKESRVALETLGDRLVATTRPVRLSPRLGVTGFIPRQDPDEGTGGDFFLDEACQTPDLLQDDQALWMRVKGGVVAVLGCGHAGVGNTLDYVSTLCGERIIGVVGGLHLKGAGAPRLLKAVEALRRHGVKWIRPGHCTGEAAVSVLERNFPDSVVPCHVGDVFEW